MIGGGGDGVRSRVRDGERDERDAGRDGDRERIEAGEVGRAGGGVPGSRAGEASRELYCGTKPSRVRAYGWP